MKGAIEIKAEGRRLKAKVKLPAQSGKPRADILIASPLSPFSPVQEAFAKNAGLCAMTVRKVLWLCGFCAFWRLFSSSQVNPASQTWSSLIKPNQAWYCNRLQTH
jgi:hypothetical protein